MTTEAVHPKCPPFLCRFLARTWCKFSYFTNSKLTLGVKFIFIISLMHTLSYKVRFVQRKLKPEEAFTTKKWMVLAEHLLAQAHILIYFIHDIRTGPLHVFKLFSSWICASRQPHMVTSGQITVTVSSHLFETQGTKTQAKSWLTLLHRTQSIANIPA